MVQEQVHGIPQKVSFVRPLQVVNSDSSDVVVPLDGILGSKDLP